METSWSTTDVEQKREMEGPGEALKRLREEKGRVVSGGSEAADKAPLVRNKQ